MSFFAALSSIREVVVSKGIDFLIDKLTSSEFLHFATEKDVREEIKKLNMELKEIRAVLDDAEERQMKEQLVKDWLTHLQNLAFDVEDVLDELTTETGKRKLMMERRASSSKIRRLVLDPCDDVIFNKGMMSKIKEVTAKLKDLEPQKNQLQLRMINGERPKRVIEARLQPTSLEIEAHVYGRDKDKQTILDSLLNSDDEGNFVIPITGMGGIGKTTLAQLVYNDASIQTHFELKAWVCVSDHFDVLRITKEVLQSITSRTCDDNDLNKVQEKLKAELSGKKFLIVFDDVWNENYHDWTILQSPFLTRTRGSKIIVTTRNRNVTSTMGASHAHSLDILSDDDSLSLFAQHALGARDFCGHPRLKDVAEKIVKKCNGLPLAVKTLGGLLRTNVDLGAWERILESEIWKLSSEHQSGLVPALQLSYHHLPLHLKRCFAYCSIIPKDYEFEVAEIILLWRAQGFLREDKQCIDDLGHNYFGDLVSRSLLQLSVNDGSRFVMHDLINDLARSVAGEMFFKIEGDQKISEHARHLSYTAGKYDGIKKFEGIDEAKQLRTFFPLSSYTKLAFIPSWNTKKALDSFLTNHVLTNLLPKLRCLRVLCLKGYQIEELSNFVGDLKLLRYLNLSKNRVIKSLPESVSSLYNLETLLLEGCEKLEKLPSEMDKLVNLCYVDVRGADSLKDMPDNFSNLTNLQSLSNFIFGKEKGNQIKELEGLSSLKGQLCISGLQNVLNPQDAWWAKLNDKTGLEKLELQWSNDFQNRRPEDEEEVLDYLQPSKMLKELTIKFYCGAMLPNWVGDSSFNKLQSLCLEDCPNLLSLPAIGKLPLLKELSIKGLKSVTSVGVEFYGKNTSNAFSSLEILKFSDMPKWESWNLCQVDEEDMKFPKLRELLIEGCPLLLGCIPAKLLSLEELTIRGCEKLKVSIQSFPLLTVLEIDGCHEVVYKGFAEDSSLKRVCFRRISKFRCAAECLMLRSIKVESLEISNCGELLSFRENRWGVLTQSMSVRVLSINRSEQIVSIGAEEEREEELMQLKIPYSVQNMVIWNCSRLEKLSTTLHSLTSLTFVHLQDCPKLISLSRSNLPLNLKVLVIQRCSNLESLMLDEGENVNSSNACVLLQRLHIERCSSLKRINRSELPSTLKQLDIQECSVLESIGQEIQDNSSLESIHIIGCDMIKELPQGLNKLKHLRSITIWRCSNLICFPESGLPTTNLKNLIIADCDRLQALPTTNSLEYLKIINCRNIDKPINEWGLHKLTSLQSLSIANCCPEDEVSSPQSEIGMMLPSSLRTLEIGGPNIWKAIMEWGGLHRLTSLQSLRISNGAPEDAVLFPESEIGMMLPSSLTQLRIWNFPKLESLSSNGFRNLTSLEKLEIRYCPILKSLPEKNMLSSLLELTIEECPMLEERCKRDGPDWSNIAHIPNVQTGYSWWLQ